MVSVTLSHARATKLYNFGHSTMVCPDRRKLVRRGGVGWGGVGLGVEGLADGAQIERLEGNSASWRHIVAIL